MKYNNGRIIVPFNTIVASFEQFQRHYRNCIFYINWFLVKSTSNIDSWVLECGFIALLQFVLCERNPSFPT